MERKKGNFYHAPGVVPEGENAIYRGTPTEAGVEGAEAIMFEDSSLGTYFVATGIILGERKKGNNVIHLHGSEDPVYPDQLASEPDE